MIKKIKNVDSVAHTWAGQEVQPGEYYTLEPQEYPRWSNDDSVISAIASDIAMMNDGTDDIAGINAQIDFLKDNMAKEVVTQMEKGDKGLRLASAEVSFDQGNALIEIFIPGNVGEVGRYIAGGYGFTDVFGWGDRINIIQLVDKNYVYAGVAYPATPFEAGVEGVTEETTWAQAVPSGVVLGSYHDDDLDEANQGWRLWCDDGNQGGVDIDPIGGYGMLYARTYLRINFLKAEGSEATKAAVNLWWGKKE